MVTVSEWSGADEDGLETEGAGMGGGSAVEGLGGAGRAEGAVLAEVLSDRMWVGEEEGVAVTSSRVWKGSCFLAGGVEEGEGRDGLFLLQETGGGVMGPTIMTS